MVLSTVVLTVSFVQCAYMGAYATRLVTKITNTTHSKSNFRPLISPFSYPLFRLESVPRMPGKFHFFSPSSCIAIVPPKKTSRGQTSQTSDSIWRQSSPEKREQKGRDGGRTRPEMPPPLLLFFARILYWIIAAKASSGVGGDVDGMRRKTRRIEDQCAQRTFSFMSINVCATSLSDDGGDDARGVFGCAFGAPPSNCHPRTMLLEGDQVLLSTKRRHLTE